MNLNFEKIKQLVLEKKKYLLVIAVILVIFLFVKKGGDENKDNQISENSISQSSSATSSSSTSFANQSSSQVESKEVTVDISGAVKHGGVYTLKNGARLQELIEAAGGLKDNAQIKAINRAVMLKDQDKIHIPYKGEKVESASTISNAGGSANSTTSNPSGSSTSGEKINLNTASAADLQKLNGIGEKKAEQIIAYRDQNGQFKKIEDLMQVSGIGEKTFAALKDQLEI